MGDGRGTVADRLRLMESAVTHTTEAVVVTDVSGDEPVIVFVNEAFCRQSGYQAGEVEGQHPRILVGPETDLDAQLALRDAVTRRSPVTVEILHYAKSGTTYWVENSLTPVFDDDGRCTHVISLQHEITARRMAQAAQFGRYAVLGGIAKGDPLATSLGRIVQMAHPRPAAVLVIEGGRLRPVTPLPLAVRDFMESWQVSSGPDPCTLAAARGERATATSGRGCCWAFPLVGTEGPLGALAVIDPAPEPDGPTDAELCELAALATVALESDRAISRLAHQATHDHLTGLPNRALLLDRLGVALDRLRRKSGTLAVMFVDLDHFKSINDTLGHNAGDGVLADLAGRLVAALRPGDTVARYGGDEFVVICEDVMVDEAREIAKRLISAALVPLPGGLEAGGASVGIALTDRAAETPAAIIRAADAAMYKAKQAGRARVEIDDRCRG